MLCLVLKWDRTYKACLYQLYPYISRDYFCRHCGPAGLHLHPSFLRERQETLSNEPTEFWDILGAKGVLMHLKTLCCSSHPFSQTRVWTHTQTSNTESLLPVLTPRQWAKTYELKKSGDWLTVWKLQVTHIANTVYLSVHNKSSRCHVTDSMENVSLHKHPICLLVMKMLFSGNAAAVFYMLSCSHARYMKGCCFHNWKISLETRQFY